MLTGMLLKASGSVSRLTCKPFPFHGAYNFRVNKYPQAAPSESHCNTCHDVVERMEIAAPIPTPMTSSLPDIAVMRF